MVPQKPYALNVQFLRRLLIIADDLIHFVIALILLCCAALILVTTIPNLVHLDTRSILHVLNDILLALIIMELMWPVVRFLRREPFSLNPFLYVGIISSTRRILLIEAEHSTLTRLSGSNADWINLWPVLVELGANVSVIFVLAVTLRLLAGCKAEKHTAFD